MMILWNNLLKIKRKKVGNIDHLIDHHIGHRIDRPIINQKIVKKVLLDKRVASYNTYIYIYIYIYIYNIFNSSLYYDQNNSL